jgi:hypothetical protein
MTPESAVRVAPQLSVSQRAESAGDYLGRRVDERVYT